MPQVRAKKSLGQHFLKDLGIARQIADTIPSGPVLEIGPGMGVLTQFLLHNKNIQLTAIELDSESVSYLCSHFPELHLSTDNSKKGINRLIQGDALKIDWYQLYQSHFSVIGNYPYNISSQIFFKVLDYKDYITVCSGMIQKEVAERISAQPGKKAYGILSVLLQAYYNIEYLFTVDSNVFAPPPKVQSAVIRLTRNSRNQLDCDETLFRTIVKKSFNQRRKQIRNSLKQWVNEHIPPNKVGELYEKEVFSKRPEQLSVDDFVELTNLLQLCQN